MKKYLIVVSLFIVCFCFSQQTENLRLIKKKYDSEVQKIETKYNDDISNKKSKESLGILNMKKNTALRILLFDAQQEYLDEISKITPKIIPLDSSKIVKNEVDEILPIYPKGFKHFQKEIYNNFFFVDEIEAKGTITSKLTFIIEKDGSIQDVKAEGINNTFNKYAVLAVYLTKEKWEPARLNGYPVRYKMAVPLTLRFD